MKTDIEYLTAAKEEVAKRDGYNFFGEIDSDLNEEYMLRSSLLALQKQREDIKLELEKLFDEAGGTLSAHFTMPKIFRNS